MDLKGRLTGWRTEIDGSLDRLLPPADDPPRSLHRAMRYAVFAGGKRLRPVLCLAACESVGGSPAAALPVGSALEMIHTYSLIHDDLPAMDDDSLRRGKPTTHVVFGEAVAILAGDALLTLAMQVLASEPPGEAMAERRSAVTALVARAAGEAGMVGGQADDLEAAGGPDGEETRLLSIHRRKTGALITASLLAGAVIAGATREQVEALGRYGEAVGLAFQIVDDILDIESTTAELGKSAGKDERDHKLTFPSVLGLEESRRRAASLCRSAVEEAERLPAGGGALPSLAAYIIERTN